MRASRPLGERRPGKSVSDAPNPSTTAAPNRLERPTRRAQPVAQQSCRIVRYPQRYVKQFAREFRGDSFDVSSRSFVWALVASRHHRRLRCCASTHSGYHSICRVVSRPISTSPAPRPGKTGASAARQPRRCAPCVVDGSYRCRSWRARPGRWSTARPRAR